MIKNIQTNNGPDLQHTLNYLALPDDPIYIAAPDFLSRDLFARYGQTYPLNGLLTYLSRSTIWRRAARHAGLPHAIVS
jgi:hypothetical protein